MSSPSGRPDDDFVFFSASPVEWALIVITVAAIAAFIIWVP